ncbi:MAG: hypothetical protein J6W21_00250 [Bacteroidaceae bacterium]|nr:hypothetical protein [Bacteroidaceae bacterium]
MGKVVYKLIIWVGLSAMAVPTFSQTVQQVDSVDGKEVSLHEVTITSAVGAGRKVAGKGHTASIEEHLLQLNNVTMIRRGSYAWEPVVNNMTTERVSTTIDGMKIFYACTDKMDPVTSYVESGNLQRIRLDTGLDGNPQATGSIGGSIDLKLRKTGFAAKKQEYNATAGYESNGHLQVYGIDAAFSSSKIYANMGAFYRHAGNYKAGGNEEVGFSQFRKVNTFLNLGWQPRQNHIIEGTVIFDRATDVGYPALNMDVSDATGLITSLSYRREYLQGFFSRWESKVYYNHITHNMDDTGRPDVVIHMDMPGRSSTAGLYSLLQGTRGNHQFQLNYDAYHNTLFADMTMYVKGAKPMYMLTWPDVGTINSGLALSDDISLGARHSLRISAKGSWQHRRINNDEGFRALSIYFPGMSRTNSDFSGRVAASYSYHQGRWKFSVGTGYGNRTPTVTEAYGYFLNNTFDRYDYIGNPALKNESAIEVNASASLTGNPIEARLEVNTFFFQNYIIGIPDSRLSAMTIGAAGVKLYQNLPSAQIVNATVNLNWQILRWLRWENNIRYSYGKENTGAWLPLIAPFSYQSKCKVLWGNVEAEVGTEVVARQNNFSQKYGETLTPGYNIWHINAGWRFNLGKVLCDLHVGIDNIFDHYYSTYSDWNHIPQKGRNIYTNISLQF